jgi:hypothetical protein
MSALQAEGPGFDARRPPEFAQLRSEALERDKFAERRLARARLETHDESDLERLR